MIDYLLLFADQVAAQTALPDWLFSGQWKPLSKCGIRPLNIVTQDAVWDYSDPENPVLMSPRETKAGYALRISVPTSEDAGHDAAVHDDLTTTLAAMPEVQTLTGDEKPSSLPGRVANVQPRKVKRQPPERVRYKHSVTVICTAADQADANLLWSALGRDTLPGKTFVAPISANGQMPATHFMAHMRSRQMFVDTLIAAQAGELPSRRWRDFGLTRPRVLALFTRLIIDTSKSRKNRFKAVLSENSLKRVVAGLGR